MAKEEKFIAMFDCNGFECIINITTDERKHFLSALKNEEFKTDIPLQQMMLRARYNPQRSPEIWSFISTVSEESLLDIACESPQALVDLIRSHGVAIYTTPKEDGVVK